MFRKTLTLVAITICLPGGPETRYLGLQANTLVNMLLYSWNPKEHRVFVKQYHFLLILSKMQAYYLTRAVNPFHYIVTSFSSQKA